MPKISELTAETSVVAADLVVIVDVSAGTTDKATVVALVAAGLPTFGSDVGFDRLGAAQAKVTDGSTGLGSLVSDLLIARQDGGVAGTDEVQISHDGTNGRVYSASGHLDVDLTDDANGLRVRRSDITSRYIELVASGNSGGPEIGASSDVRFNQTIWLDQKTVAFSGGGNVKDVAFAWAAAGVIKVTNGSTGTGSLLCTSLVEANTAGSGSPNILTAVESRTVLTNEGATAQAYHTLPSAAAGLDFEFVVQDSDGIRVVANTGDTIRDVGTVSTTAGYIQSTTVGSVVRLKAINATEWLVVYKQGTWTIDS